MSLYLGSKNVCPTKAIMVEKFSMKAFFEAGGKCGYSDMIDLTNCCTYTDTENIKSFQYMFYQCTKLKRIPFLNTAKVTNMGSMFSGDTNLESVPAFDAINVTNLRYAFNGCSSLTKVSLRNIQASIDISASTLFTRENLLEVINNLQTVKQSKNLTIGSVNISKLTADDIAIATNKGWNIL